MPHRLLWIVLMLCSWVGIAGAATADTPLATPAASAASVSLPLADEAAYTAEINAWLERQRREQEAYLVRQAWIARGVLLGLTAGFAVFALAVWRTGRPPLFKASRILLWTPCFLLAATWFFPMLIIAVLAFAPVLPWLWWKRVLPWLELAAASVLYLTALGGLWLVFSTLAQLASQGAGR
ncbi:hypothetical protein N8I74_10520 [Chitiniphilus purpureus]|uniref:Uncharacterized protein n=1 Tax=Chitiniphilus purpureus TaxID=2981137 RepID=A0ABY6DHD7_9NEIS|nr:hypothetical protein [Chitiniphilus sp. CD1]UXY13755.1 hypothetical protein N8I74_10520 [Chitiniphilus sp. CD1]